MYVMSCVSSYNTYTTFPNSVAGRPVNPFSTGTDFSQKSIPALKEYNMITVSPRINVHALIFENAISFRK